MKELKELDDVPASRKLGQHIRRKIGSAKKQIQFGANQGLPSILLLYNSFGDGIEDIDFMTAMYGELTVDVKKSTLKMAGEPYHGRNNKLSKTDNTSFSAVERLSLNHRAKSQSDKLAITLFENAFSKVKVPWEHLPSCFDVRRVEIT